MVNDDQWMIEWVSMAMGVHPKSWMVDFRETPNLKWMMTGGYLHLWKPPLEARGKRGNGSGCEIDDET